MCKNCAKGLCAESAIDVGDGLACPSPCEKRVEQMNAMFGNADAMASTWSSFMGPWMLAVGAAFVAFGAFAWASWGDTWIGAWLVVLGGIFAATPARELITARLRGF